MTAAASGDLAQQVAGLQFEARRLAAGVLAGLHRSVHRGGSAEFVEYAEYVAGEDPRAIDWKAVGKTDRYFVKRFEESTNRRTYLLLDASASMGFSRGGRPAKLDTARIVLGALGSLLLSQGDSVGAGVLQDGGETARLPARARGGHLDALLACLGAASAAGGTGLPAALDAALLGMERRSLVVLATDFVDDVEATGAALRRMAARAHEIVVVQVLDKDEIDFPFVGQLRFRDSETGEELTADTALVAEGYRKELAGFLAAAEAECAASRADLVRLTNAEDPAPSLLAFLARRRALARRLTAAR